jgi:glycosyltransferase involved in cell wall biosynthesis
MAVGTPKRSWLERLQRELGRTRTFWREARRTLDGRRFAELREALEADVVPVAETVTFALEHSARRLADTSGPRPDIAVISCMPPAETGIASATLLTFREADYPVDIYAHYGSAQDYLSAITDQRLASSQVRVFHLSTLPLGQQALGYRAQVYALGNSDHNQPVMRALRRNRHFPSPCRLVVHLHDPCLANILARTMREERRELRQVIWSCYGVDLGEAPSQGRMAEAGILGLRPLLAGVDVDLVIVNSAAAAQMVRRELPNHRVEAIFHPVFASHAADARQPTAQGALIGSFGVPGVSKRSEVVIEAFEEIRRRRPNARLVIAGYEAGPFARSFNLRPESGYDVHDSPSDGEFARLMASVDIAVQLRKENLGENSGVMARIAGLNVPVITSPGRAFDEYAPFASVLRSEEGAPELATLILNQLKSDCDGSAAERRLYAASRQPDLFCARLQELVR